MYKLQSFAKLYSKTNETLYTIYLQLQLISAPKLHCCNFDGSVPWAFPLEFVCKSRVESRVQYVTNGAEKLVSAVDASDEERLHLPKSDGNPDYLHVLHDISLKP